MKLFQEFLGPKQHSCKIIFRRRYPFAIFLEDIEHYKDRVILLTFNSKADEFKKTFLQGKPTKAYEQFMIKKDIHEYKMYRTSDLRRIFNGTAVLNFIKPLTYEIKDINGIKIIPDGSSIIVEHKIFNISYNVITTLIPEK